MTTTRRLRKACIGCVLTIVLPGTAIARQPAAQLPSPAQLQQLVQQAETKAQSYHDHLPPLPPLSDTEALRVLADDGRQRGEAAFEQMQQPGGLWGSATPPASTPNAAAPGTATPVAVPKKSPGLLVLALSSSMPEPMLRDYMAQLDGQPDAVVVLRGFIGGAHTVAPTGRWIERVLRSDPDCLRCRHRSVRVVVDPLLFRSLKIERVPALAWLGGVQTLQHCEQETYTTAAVAYGAAPIAAALQALDKAGVVVPQPVSKQFEARGWQDRKTAR
jgi:type-F conjugative transfer system pilin assembly protein TrbC